MRRLRRGRACARGVIFDGVRWGRVRGRCLGWVVQVGRIPGVMSISAVVPFTPVHRASWLDGFSRVHRSGGVSGCGRDSREQRLPQFDEPFALVEASDRGGDLRSLVRDFQPSLGDRGVPG